MVHSRLQHLRQLTRRFVGTGYRRAVIMQMVLVIVWLAEAVP